MAKVYSQISPPDRTILIWISDGTRSVLVGATEPLGWDPADVAEARRRADAWVAQIQTAIDAAPEVRHG